MYLSSLYDNPDYSDLAIALSDGRKIRVHKSILCTFNQYFKAACGVDSQFAERDLCIIELKEDNPDAVEHVLRHIYKISSAPPETCPKSLPPWHYWLNVYVAADKYLEPELSATADITFRTLAMSLEDADDIMDVVLVVGTKMNHDAKIISVGTELIAAHLRDLLKNDRFRYICEGNSKTMWGIIEQLARI